MHDQPAASSQRFSLLLVCPGLELLVIVISALVWGLGATGAVQAVPRPAACGVGGDGGLKRARWRGVVRCHARDGVRTRPRSAVTMHRVTAMTAAGRIPGSDIRDPSSERVPQRVMFLTVTLRDGPAPGPGTANRDRAAWSETRHGTHESDFLFHKAHRTGGYTCTVRIMTQIVCMG